MKTATRVHGEINNDADLKRTFTEIGSDAARASSRDELTKLYRHAESLITLTYTPAWQKKFDGDVEKFRRLAESEFATTAHAINQRATQIGAKADYDETWGGKQHVYGEVNNDADLRKIFSEIQRDVAQAGSRDDLTKLFRRAEYLVTLTYAPAWQKKFGAKVADLRQVAEREFGATADKINQRARQVGVAADYDTTWGSGH